MSVRRLIERIYGHLVSIIQFLTSGIGRIIFVIFPPVGFHWNNRKHDFSFRVTENEDSLYNFQENIKENLSNFTGDIDKVLSTAKKSHQLELERSSELDNKASTYFTNVSIVLSILSLGPIIAVAIGISVSEFGELNRIQLVSLISFGYAITMFFLSTFYSYWVIKITVYEPFYSAKRLEDRLSASEFGAQKQVLDLMTCRKKNEEYTQKKINKLFVAESSHRNGMVALALGILTAAVVVLI